MPHDNPTSLHLSDTVMITFELQKNDSKLEKVMQWQTQDNVLCPVKQLAAIVRRILSYPYTNENTHISAYWANNKHEHITGEMMTNALQAMVDATRCDRLGISTIGIDTHSIRSGVAMAMYLNNAPLISIIKIGRWKSTAFLDYI